MDTMTLPGSPGPAPGTPHPSAADATTAPRRAVPRAGAGGPGALVTGGLAGTVHVVLGMWWGWVLFVGVVVLLALGVALVPVFLLGIPVLALALVVAGRLGDLERARIAAVLGEVVPAAPRRRWPPGRLPRLRAAITSGPRWRAVAWLVVAPVLATLWTAFVLSLWSVALALVTLPLWQDATPSGGWWRELHVPVAVGVLAGIALVPVALVVARGCAAVDVTLARALLGASRTAALTDRVEVLTATRSAVVDAADAERRRIERDLHDGAQQRLVALAVDLGMASAKLASASTVPPGEPERAAAETAAASQLVARAHAEAKQALAELRDLARGIHPAVLTDRGLDAALSALAARSPVPVDVDVALAHRCSATVEATAYFVVAEALTNVAKHSGAHRAAVTVRSTPEGADGTEQLVVTVTDDGRGGVDPTRGTGLTGMGRRVAGADGSLVLTSPDGGPTVLEVRIPCA